jgi:hypothetical protein
MTAKGNFRSALLSTAYQTGNALNWRQAVADLVSDAAEEYGSVRNLMLRCLEPILKRLEGGAEIGSVGHNLAEAHEASALPECHKGTSDPNSRTIFANMPSIILRSTC